MSENQQRSMAAALLDPFAITGLGDDRWLRNPETGVPVTTGNKELQETVTVYMNSPGYKIYRVAVVGACSYHGYKRHRDSVGGAVGWAALGYFFGIIPLTVSLFQGYGKPKK